MSKELTKKPNVLGLMAQKYGLGDTMFMNTLKATVMKADKTGKVPSNEEIAAFLLVAQKYDLNPFTKEIYAFPDKRAGIIPIVGVDGFITLANRHPQFDGYEIEWSAEDLTLTGAKKCPEWCEIKIYRKDREHPITVREYLEEVYQPARNGYSGPWQSHTRRMLRHKTMIQGFRVAFGFTGIYDEDEAHRITEGEIVDIPQSGKPDVSMPEELPQGDPSGRPEQGDAEEAKLLLAKHFPDQKKRAEWLHARFGTTHVEELSPEKLTIALKVLADMEAASA